MIFDHNVQHFNWMSTITHMHVYTQPDSCYIGNWQPRYPRVFPCTSGYLSLSTSQRSWNAGLVADTSQWIGFQGSLFDKPCICCMFTYCLTYWTTFLCHQTTIHLTHPYNICTLFIWNEQNKEKMAHDNLNPEFERPFYYR